MPDRKLRERRSGQRTRRPSPAGDAPRRPAEKAEKAEKAPAELAPVRKVAASSPAGGRTLRGIVLALVLALAAVLAWREETSLDLGFHLATGRQILAERAWPRADEFTYTVAGRPYLDMHGLFQVGLALAERGRGYAGIGLYRAGLLLAAVLLVWASARRRGVRSPLVLALGFTLGLVAWELRFFARPELATYLALALSLYWLRRHAESGDWRWLIGLIPLQLLWVHAHALSFFGIAVLGLYALASLRHPARPPWAPWLVLAGAVLAMFLNPYGPAGVEFLWHLRTRLSDENPFAQTISELSSPWNRAALAFWPMRAFTVLLVAGGIAVLAAIRRLPLFDLLVFGLFAALAASAVRNIGLFVVAGLPVALAAVESLAAKPRRRRPPARAIPIAPIGLALALTGMVLFGALVWTGGYYASNRRPERFGSGPSPATYPLRTVRFLAEQGLPGPIFNHLNFGGFLIGELWPKERVFIDGRLEVMGEEFFQEYLGINAGPGWAAMMARHDPNVALIPITSPQQLNRLAQDPEWQLAELDGVAALFLRVRPENASLVADARRRFAALEAEAASASAPFLPKPLPAWPRGIFARRVFPWEAWGRGNGLYALKRYDAARSEYRRALESAGPGELPLALNYAAAAFHRGRAEEAGAWYRRVLELEPGNPLARERLRRLASAGAGPGK